MFVNKSLFADPLVNLNYDDELLRLAESGGGEMLRFWESPSYFVVLGRTCREEDDVEWEAVRRDGIPVMRRSSGGGTVLQGPGCLNFSLVLSKKTDPSLNLILESYRYILDRVILAMADIGVVAGFRPICDLVVQSSDKKFSGNAQRRGKGFILHHGTILYAFDLALISKYLKMPKKMPEYRFNRAHTEFITNISVKPEDICRAIAARFSSQW